MPARATDTTTELAPTELIAITRLVHHLAGRLARKVGRPHLADDLAQIGLETAWRVARNHEPERGKLTTFVYPRARGAMLDALDADLHGPQPDSDALDLTPCHSPTAEEQLADARDQARQLALAQAGLDRLDPIDRHLVERCIMHDQKIVQISAQLGVDYDWARWRLKRAIATLKGACE